MKKTFSQITLLLLTAISLSAQDAAEEKESSGSKLDLDFQTIFTEAEKWAVGVAADYIKPFNGAEYFTMTQSGFVDWSPELRIRTGGEDAFDGIFAAVRGHYLISPNLSVDDIMGPDPLTLHVFPFAVGTETNRDFSNTNALAEFGYAPWYLPKKQTYFKLGKSIAVGLFGQVGYKINDAENLGGGGNADASEEQESEMLLRVKFALKTEPFRLFAFEAFGKDIQTSIQPDATVWYDIANTQTYYSVGAKFVIKLDEEKSLDFGYRRGSGAPNFNEGDQFSGGLKITF